MTPEALLAVIGSAALVNTGLLTGIFFRLGSLCEGLKGIEGRVTRLDGRVSRLESAAQAAAQVAQEFEAC